MKLKRSALLLLVAAPLAWMALKAFRAAQAEHTCFHPRRGPVAEPKPPFARPVRAVRFGIADGSVMHGWYVPSLNGAAVVLAHGSSADRTQLVPEARVLVDAGYGVLMFDWPGHGESEGRVRLGEPELEALRGAVDTALAQPDVRDGRVGAYGFSIGGALVAVGAARDPRVRAVVLAGTFADADEHLDHEYRRYGLLTQLPARAVVRMNAGSGFRLRPLDAARALETRPVLVITGEADELVPRAMSEQLYGALRGDKRLLVVPNAGHGEYLRAAEGTYREALVRFFDAALASR